MMMPPIPLHLAQHRESNSAIFVEIGQELAELQSNVKFRIRETGFQWGSEPNPITAYPIPLYPARCRRSNSVISVKIRQELAELQSNMIFRFKEIGFQRDSEPHPMTACPIPLDLAR